MNILFVGDIFGSAGRHIVREHLPHVLETNDVDLLIINGENAAGGFGLTPSIAEELFDLGAHVITTGNHIWDKKEIFEYMTVPAESHARGRRVLRPANYAVGTPGFGLYQGELPTGQRYAVMNLQGRVFLTPIDDPFRKADAELAKLPPDVAFVLVDMHAETTSEKQAMGHFADGRASLVVGTHTHAPTADHQILPGGTAFISDVGMTGDYNSVIGMAKEEPLVRFIRRIPAGKFEPAMGPATLCGVAVETDDATGLARHFTAVRLGGRLESARPAFWD